MATLYVEEFHEAAPSSGLLIQCAQQPSTSNNVTYTGTAGVSNAFGANTKFIRITSDSICSFVVSTAGTSATTNNARLPLGAVEYFGVKPGDKISAIVNT